LFKLGTSYVKNSNGYQKKGPKKLKMPYGMILEAIFISNRPNKIIN